MGSCAILGFQMDVASSGDKVTFDRRGFWLGDWEHVEIDPVAKEANVTTGFWLGKYDVPMARMTSHIDPETNTPKTELWGEAVAAPVVMPVITPVLDRIVTKPKPGDLERDVAACAKSLGNTPDGPAVMRLASALAAPRSR